jgi:hypothetical protein
VPLEVTCKATGTVDVFVSVSQRSGSGVAEVFAFESVGRTGSSEQITVVVQATGGKVFRGNGWKIHVGTGRVDDPDERRGGDLDPAG